MRTPLRDYSRGESCLGPELGESHSKCAKRSHRGRAGLLALGQEEVQESRGEVVDLGNLTDSLAGKA